MRSLLIGAFLLFASVLFGHDEVPLSIENVLVSQLESAIRFDFDLRNSHKKSYDNVKIELLINNEMVRQMVIDHVKETQGVLPLSFMLGDSEVNLLVDQVTIEITEIFGVRGHWSVWNNKTIAKQVNTIDSEFYADAPWRMKKLDETGNIQGVPVHFFLHDADEVPLFDLKIDNINIQLKNAVDASFDPVLSYNLWSFQDFRELFSCLSRTDGALSIKEFDLNSFSASSSQTIDFDIDSDFLGEFVEVGEKYWFFTFMIPPSDLVGYNNVIDIQVTIEYANLSITDDVIGLRVFRSDEDVPEQSGWFRGDTHLHSMYTQSDAEIGLPLCATKMAAQLSGLDWITTTDHTSDFDNYGSSISSNWVRIRDEVEAFNLSDSSMIFIPGQEVAVTNSDNKLVHMLAYPNPLMPVDMPFLGDGNGDLVATTVTLNNTLDNIDSYNGFAYAAHPFATGDQLPTIPVNGGIWNVSNPNFPVNGNSFPLDGGGIVCNDLSLDSDVFSSDSVEVVKNRLKGAQIWNMRNSLVASGDQNNPWNDFSPLDSNDQEFHFRRFRQGQEVINNVNQLGLMAKNGNNSTQNWKMFYSAGSDAHGSFNYSNTDDFASLGTITNNAVGKLGTIAYCPNGMGANGKNILRALEQGRTVLSDGPIVTMGVSTNGNDGVNEVLLGDDVLLNYDLLSNYFMNVDYTSTNEFGSFTYLRCYVGTETGEQFTDLPLTTPTGNGSMSLTLDALFAAVFGGNPPMDEYFYIRLELETLKDYTGQQVEFITDSETFHSITNPIWIRLEQGVGIDDNELSEVKIYPNPSNVELNIVFSASTNYAIIIYDQAGRVVRETDGFGLQLKMDVSNLSQGLYFMDVSWGNKRVNRRFTKSL